MQPSSANRSRSSIYPLLPVFALACISQMALQATRPMVSLRASELGAGSVQVGLIAGTMNLAQLVLALTAGKTSDRHGPKTAALFGSVALVIGLSGLPLATHWMTLLLFQTLTGVGQLFGQVGYQSQVTLGASGTKREDYVGLLFFVVAAGQAMGPLLGGWVGDAMGLRAAFVLGAALSVVALVMAVLMPARPVVPQEAATAPAATASPATAPATKAQAATAATGGSPFALLREPMVASALYISMAALLAMDVLTTYFPLYGKQNGLSAANIGLALSLRNASTTAIRPFMGRLTRLFGRPALVMVSLVVGGLGIALFGVGQHLAAIMLIAVLAGLGLGLAQPLSMVMVSEASGESRRGQALALRLMGNRLGQTASPVLFGFLAAWFGLAPVFWVSGAVLAVSARFGLSMRGARAGAGTGAA